MITESELYWITRMDYIHGTLLAFTIASFFIFITFVIETVVVISSGEKEVIGLFKKYSFYSFLFFFLFLIQFVLIPTTKEIAAIKGIPAIANSKFVSQDAEAYIRRLCEAVIGKIEQNGESKKKEK